MILPIDLYAVFDDKVIFCTTDIRGCIDDRLFAVVLKYADIEMSRKRVIIMFLDEESTRQLKLRMAVPTMQVIDRIW